MTIKEILNVPENFVFKSENINILSSLQTKSWENIDKRNFKANETFWLKLDFPNGTNNKTHILWKASQLYSVESYVVEKEKILAFSRAGFKVPYSEKKYFSTDLIINLEQVVNTQNTTVYLKLNVCSKSPYFPRLLSSKEVSKYLTWDIVIMTSYISTLLILCLYQISVYINIKDRASLDYAIFCFGMLLPALARSGYFDLFMSAYNWPISISKYLVYFIALAFFPAVIFTRSYFNTKINFPKMDLLFKAQMTFFSCCYLYLILAEKTDLLWKVAPSFNLIASLIVVTFSGYAVYKNEIGSSYYFMAWTGFLGGLTYFNLATVGVINMPVNMRYITNLSGMYEAILMSIGLSYRLKKFKDIETMSELKKVENQTLHLMLKILSHDVANPLAIIKGTVRNLKNKFYNDVDFAKIEKNIEFIMNVTETVRTYEALDAGKIKFQNSSADLVAGVKHCLHLFEHKASEKSIKFALHRPEKVSAICIDQKMLETNIIPNLYSNALKFSHPNSEIKVVIGENDYYVTLSIEDFGIGIPQDLLAKIFDMQTGTTRKGTQNESGTGFGLPLIKKVLDLFSGKIEAYSQDSEENHGTKVTVYFKKYVKEHDYQIGNVA